MLILSGMARNELRKTRHATVFPTVKQVKTMGSLVMKARMSATRKVKMKLTQIITWCAQKIVTMHLDLVYRWLKIGPSNSVSFGEKLKVAVLVVTKFYMFSQYCNIIAKLINPFDTFGSAALPIGTYLNYHWERCTPINTTLTYEHLVIQNGFVARHVK